MKKIGYLSAAPRVSTHPEAEASGPRAHVLGVIRAFESLGYPVKRYIVGDRVPSNWRGKGSEAAVSGNWLRTLLIDITRLILGFVNAQRALRELGGEVDWVYERFAALQSLGWIFQRRGIPWLLETSGPFFYEAKFSRKSVVLGGLARRIEVGAYRQCDVLVCVSETLKDIVVREAQVSPQKVLVIPNGVDVEFFNPDAYQPKRLFPGVTIGFVGTLTNWQALDLLLQAMSEVKNQGIDLSLVVVGDGLMLEDWKSLTQNLGLADRVRFVGRLSQLQVPEAISGIDVGYSGQIESPEVGKMYHSPLKIYEYMAMAKPVMASAFEDAQRTLKEGETGFLFPAGDLEGIKQALVRVYEARERLSQMGEQARREVVTQHSWQARVQDMVAKTEAILSQRRR